MNLPLKTITQVVKAEEHPQIVLLTQQTYDNLRISTSNDQRCQNIISSLAFYFTYLAHLKRPIKVYSIKQNSLLFFQRTVKQKKSGPKLNFDRYLCSMISYMQPNDSPDIFGKIVVQKMVLSKQIYVEGSHLVHIAKVNDAEHYICHTIDKCEQVKLLLSKHKNIQGVQKLQYARLLQYKIQLFFQFLPSLKQRTAKLTFLFEQLYKLYDLVQRQHKNGFITPNMLLKASQDSNNLILRQFRYSFLIFQHDYSRFIYRKIQNQQNIRDFYINKMFNIGLILYEHLYSRVLFQHQDLQITLYLKENMNAVPFPKHIGISCSNKTQAFIQSCILGKFQTEEDIIEHPWIKINKINL